VFVRRVVQNLALAGLAAALAFALVEGALRIVEPIAVSSDVEYVPDGHVSFRLAPSRVYRLASGGVCTVNGQGFRRAEEVVVPKPRGVFRIVALGGSSTFAYQVGDTETWTHLLEAELRQRFGGSIEVVNAGAPGYSTFDSKIHYVYRIRRLAPDAAILYETWNDLKRFRALEELGYFLRGVPRPRVLERWLRHSQVAWRARNLYLDRVVRARREDYYPSRAAFSEVIPSDGVAQRWERQNFEDLASWLERDGVLPILVTQAGLLSAAGLGDPGIRRLVEVDYVGMSHALLLEQWEIVSEMIREVARAHDAVLVDARREVPATPDHFFDAVHLTARGNEALAGAIARVLAEDARFQERVRARIGMQP
jgi:lysophospholipase L1-like esterase